MITEGRAEENIVKCLQIEFSLISTLLDLYVSVLDISRNGNKQEGVGFEVLKAIAM
jgi:hypothetical protein